MRLQSINAQQQRAIPQSNVMVKGKVGREDQSIHLRVVSTCKYVEEVDKKRNVAIGAGVDAVDSFFGEEDAAGGEVHEDVEQK
jgi:hypothetical protein